MRASVCSFLAVSSVLLSILFSPPANAVPAAETAASRKDVFVTNSFQISFQCESDTAFCTKAEAAFQRAAQRISSEFKFRRTIVVDLAMFSPCSRPNAGANCSKSAILGFATPAQHIGVKHLDDSLNWQYPTALLKQLDLDGLDQLTWPRYDIMARFNVLANWWFPDDGADLVRGQSDMELVAAHEMMHGLGFGDDSLMSLQTNPNASILLPFYNSFSGLVSPVVTETSSPTNGGLFYQFMGPTIWNRFMMLGTKSVLDAFVIIARRYNELIVGKVQGMAAAVVPTLLNDPEVVTTARQLFASATTASSLTYKPSVWPKNNAVTNATTMTLETSLNPFRQGSSLAHLDFNLNKTAEFLMVFQSGPQTFTSLINQTGAPTSGIGPQTKLMMLAMGYTSASDSGFKSRRDILQLDASVKEQSKSINTSNAFRLGLNVGLLSSLCIFWCLMY